MMQKRLQCARVCVKGKEGEAEGEEEGVGVQTTLIKESVTICVFSYSRCVADPLIEIQI